MKDRIVEHPKRYRLVQVQGHPDQYDLIAAPGQVTEVGTPINKTTLLQDATLAKYTNTESTKNINETPDGVLQALARANATSIVTILANSPEYKNIQNQTRTGFMQFSNKLYDATGKSTNDKVYIPKGIKKVRVSATFYWELAKSSQASFDVFVCKNGDVGNAQSMLLKFKPYYDGVTYRDQETAEIVFNTVGNGTEYLQIGFSISSSPYVDVVNLSCLRAEFQMLTY